MIRAVIFDLDDTLYDQRQWLDGAWRAVAARAEAWDLDPDRLLHALRDVAAAGSDRGGIIDGALAQVGRADVPRWRRCSTRSAPTHRPASSRTPASRPRSPRLAARVPLGLVSDGDPGVQLAKLAALGLAPHFTTVVLSDESGGRTASRTRSPSAARWPTLGVDAADAVYIGDRPVKDVAGPAAVGMRAIRVRTGEWGSTPDDPRAWRSVAGVLDTIAVIHTELDQAADRPQAVSAP